MGKYVNGTFVPDENDLLLQQQQKMAGLQSTPQPQQAVSQSAPVTQPNPEVAQFAQAKANNQVNNSPRVAGQAGTVYNIFKQQVPKEAADKMQQLENESRKAGAVIDEGPGYVNQGAGNRGGGQNQPITSTDDLARAMGYTSPEEEDRLRKASVANQRIMAVADALRHIGNIANTVGYAPSQQFNSPVEMERQRYLQGKALRDKANLTYINYQQAKAAQDAKQRQWEAQFKYNMDKDARDYALKKNESDARANLNEAKIQRYNTLMELDQARREGVISDNEWRKRRAELYPQLTQSQIDKNYRTGSGKSSSGGGAKGDNLAGRVVEESRTYTDDGKTATITKKWTNTNNGGGGSSKTSKTIKGYKTKGGSSGKGKAY